MQPYIETVLDYDGRINIELEKNLDRICFELKISKEKFNQSQMIHINNDNSPLLIGVEETLSAKIPDHLTV